MSFAICLSIHSLMSGYNKPWFVAGGWAIDLFIGRETRPHDDIEIAIFREDQLELKKYLNEWDFNKVANRKLSPWKGEFLELPIHELHASHKMNGDSLEILLNESKGKDWIYRRNSAITYPLDSVWCCTSTGIPFLNPEVVLLYKSKNTRKKDHQDFLNVKELIDDPVKKWLQNAIYLRDPSHEWIRLLE